MDPRKSQRVCVSVCRDCGNFPSKPSLLGMDLAAELRVVPKEGQRDERGVCGRGSEERGSEGRKRTLLGKCPVSKSLPRAGAAESSTPIVEEGSLSSRGTRRTSDMELNRAHRFGPGCVSDR